MLESRNIPVRRILLYEDNMRTLASIIALGSLLISCGSNTASKSSGPRSKETLQQDKREVHLENVRQLTFDAGENAEAYWAFDGSELIMQSKRKPFSCDQIYRQPLDGSQPKLVSTGLGRTTCSYFLPGDKEIVYSSTHKASDTCPEVPDHSQGYVWPIYRDYDIFVANADGSNLRKLTDTPYYDAEATVCAADGTILFTSTRNGDLDLYKMDRDGSNVVQLTDTPGYDGGAFFSKDCSQIVWRASRPKGDARREYERLLGNGLVKPSKLEIFVADSDGQNVRQLTYLNAASFAPFFHPSGTRVLFSSNFAEAGGREFDIWAVNTDGTDLERITYAPGFDGFPMFSPDGTKLAFSSNRNQANKGETDVYVADWIEQGHRETPAKPHTTGAEAFLSDVAWLADDAREGRGVGTQGIEDAAEWLAKRFETLGLSPGGSEGFYQSLDVTTSVRRGANNALKIGKKTAGEPEFVPMGFSGNGTVSAKTVFVGHGIFDADLGIDEYKGRDVKGKIAVAYRYTSKHEAFKIRKNRERHESLHRKAFVAREHGALALVIINEPYPGTKNTEENPLPRLALDRLGGVGIPVVVAHAAFASGLASRTSAVTVEVDLTMAKTPSRNVIGKLSSTAADKRPGALVIGAHYDHLGFGGENSLSDKARAIHNGADDNASGVAGLLQIAAKLAESKSLPRDVYFVAFTGEESGLLGSKFYVESISKEAPPIAMLNMDMIGRLRDNHLSVVGTTTAAEWPAIAHAACAEHRVACVMGGDGYGPSDHSSFTTANVPVLYFSTGAHSDYHKPSDDSKTINAIGGAVVADLVLTIATSVATQGKALTFQKSKAPTPSSRRAFGASLGTIPDYSGDASKPGMLLAGVRPGGAADLAGMKSGDRILMIANTSLHSVKDLVYVLQSAKPGDEAVAKVERGGTVMMLKFKYQESKRK